MTPTIHFIISRSRSGWAVNVDSDRLSDHVSVEAARRRAAALAQTAARAGTRARIIDLSRALPRPHGA